MSITPEEDRIEHVSDFVHRKTGCLFNKDVHRTEGLLHNSSLPFESRRRSIDHVSTENDKILHNSQKIK